MCFFTLTLLGKQSRSVHQFVVPKLDFRVSGRI